MPQPIIKRSRVKLHAPEPCSSESGIRLLEGEDEGARNGEKAVRLLNEGGQVCAIEFTCSCGETTLVELLYPDDSPEQRQTKS